MQKYGVCVWSREYRGALVYKGMLHSDCLVGVVSDIFFYVCEKVEKGVLEKTVLYH